MIRTSQLGTGLSQPGVMIFGSGDLLLVSSDSASGSDAVAYVQPGSAETGFAADAVSRVSPSSSDTSSGADAVSRVLVSSSDSGSGAEGALLGLQSAETSSTVDAVVRIALADYDAGVGYDLALGPPPIAFPVRAEVSNATRPAIVSAAAATGYILPVRNAAMVAAPDVDGEVAMGGWTTKRDA